MRPTVPLVRRCVALALTLVLPALAAPAPARAQGADSNLKLALDGPLQLSGSAAAFFVAEQRQGRADLDGDAKTRGAVLHVFSAASRMTLNTRFAASGSRSARASQSALSDKAAVFLVSEKERAMDLNGDGDMDDSVVQVLDLASGEAMNLRLAGAATLGKGVPGLVASGNRVAFAVSEADQGKTDLNGDGDADDLVLHQFDLPAKTITNRRQAIASLALAGDVLAFGVREMNQGKTDLNGDGDLGDSVLHVITLADGITTNTVRAVDRFSMHGPLIVFDVSEAEQGGMDLDGNKKVGDPVLHVFNAETRRTMNVGVRTVGDRAAVGGELVAFAVSESQRGEDLNGDGDKSDDVVELFDAARATTTTTGLACAPGPEAFEVSDALVAVRVSEKASGQDLNGDGDLSDDVLHVFERGRRAPLNLGLALAPKDAFEASGRVVTFRVSEKEEGNKDLDGDGDTSDEVLHMFTGGKPQNLALEAESMRLDGDHAAFLVDEAKQGKDLNGDGDLKDRVVHVLDTGSGRATALLASRSAPQVLGDTVAFLVSEADQTGMDLDGDGDRSDEVLHLFDVRSGDTMNLGRATDQFVLGSGLLAFTVPESKQGMDLNGDGDTSDSVVHALSLLPPAPPERKR